jgi:hypothetical protein
MPGERYYTWSFRYGGTRRNCHLHPPKPSELTQSKMGEVYSAVEGAEADLAEATTPEEITDAVQAVAEVARDVAAEYEEAAEHFGGEGENAERAYELEGWADDLESWGPDIDYDDDDDDDPPADQIAAAVEQAQEMLNGCPL